MPQVVQASVDRLLGVVDELDGALGPAVPDSELLEVLGLCAQVARRVERVAVGVVADLSRRGVFADRGYRSVASALADLLGCDRADAARLVLAADHVRARIALDGTPLPPRLAALAERFDRGEAGVRHVETAARALGSAAAGRLAPEVWAAAEAQVAAQAPECSPRELGAWAAALVDALDADGPDPDDRPPAPVDELRLQRHRAGGGSLTGRFDSAELYDAVATAVDALAAPRDPDDRRPLPTRQAHALADLCGQSADHGDLPQTGRRPALSVLVRLEDLKTRARGAVLEFGSTLSPAALRTLACDAAVVPIVLGGASQPLDVGRATRTIPDGMRRAVTARDRGCAWPGCDQPPSWCECHHIIEWEHHGDTKIDLMLLCKHHHRLIHATDRAVRIRHGHPEFIPPRWIDPQQTPRRRPRPPLTA